MKKNATGGRTRLSKTVRTPVERLKLDVTKQEVQRNKTVDAESVRTHLLTSRS